MNVALIALAAVVGLYDTAHPRQVRVHVVICEGDPLGSKEAGNVKYLVDSSLVTFNGRPLTVQHGAGVVLPKVGGQRAKEWLGVAVEVVPVICPGKGMFLDVQTTRRYQPEKPGGADICEQTSRVTAVLKPGTTFRVRIAAESPESQTWAEVTAVEEPRGK